MVAFPTATAVRAFARSALVAKPTPRPNGGLDGGRDGGGYEHELARRADALSTMTVPGYSHYGCYTDYGSMRMLQGAETDLNNANDADLCCSWCANMGTDMTICGVEYGYQCFCDSTVNGDLGSDTAPASECSGPCTGRAAYACGAAARIQLYSATVAITAAAPDAAASAAATVASVDGYRYLGCFSDSSSRVLGAASTWVSLQMNAAYCCTMCLNANNGNVLCGVENAGQCYCDSTTTLALPASAADCSMPCLDNTSELCGGYFRMNIYEATGVASPSSPSSGASTASTASTTSTAATTTAPPPSPGPSGLSGGAVAGIAVGSVAGVALAAGLAYSVWRVARQRRMRPGQPEKQTVPLPAEAAGQARYEMSGTTPAGSHGVYELPGAQQLAHG